jgi:hypothetical protein
MTMKLFHSLSFAAAAFVLAGLTACSDTSEKKEDNAADASQPAAEECADNKCPAKMKPTYGKLGLAGHCSYSLQDTLGCFSCTPRDLPRTVCTDVDPGFVPETGCEYDLDLMTCNVKAEGEPFEIDFSEQTQMEKIYNKIPLFLLGAKVLIGGKLKDKPVEKELLFGCFDAVLTHKKAIFTKGDLTALLDEVGAQVKKAKPELKDEDIAAVKKSMKAAADKLQESYGDGKIEDKDFLEFAQGVLSSLPAELLGNTLQQLDITEILNSLQANGSTDVIQDILTNGGTAEEAVNAAENAGAGGNP